MLEWYARDFSYMDIANQCRLMIQYITKSLNIKDGCILYENNRIDILRPWSYLTIKEAFERYSPTGLQKALMENSFDDIMTFEIEPRLGSTSPTIIYDYPASMAALAKLKPDNKDIAQRFEIYIAGIELANGFTELTDPVEQRLRFKKEIKLRQLRKKTINPHAGKILRCFASHAGHSRHCTWYRQTDNAFYKQPFHRRCSCIYPGSTLIP